MSRAFICVIKRWFHDAGGVLCRRGPERCLRCGSRRLACFLHGRLRLSPAVQVAVFDCLHFIEDTSLKTLQVAVFDGDHFIEDNALKYMPKKKVAQNLSSGP